MNLKISDLEDKIDKEYSDRDIVDITGKGITLPDCFIDFKECSKFFAYSTEEGIMDRKYVGARNCLTNPTYMKFRVRKEDVFILFSSKDMFYEYVHKIYDLGYETFDLS